MIVYVLKDEPRSCIECVMCNEDGVCLACDSIYIHRNDKKPYWCMIKHAQDLNESEVKEEN